MTYCKGTFLPCPRDENCFPRIVMQPHLETIDTLHTMRRVCRVQRFVCDKCITKTHWAIHKWHIELDYFCLVHFSIVGHISYLHLHRQTLQELPHVLICVLMMNIFQLFDNKKKTTNRSWSIHLQLKQQCMTRPRLKKPIWYLLLADFAITSSLRYYLNINTGMLSIVDCC